MVVSLIYIRRNKSEQGYLLGNKQCYNKPWVNDNHKHPKSSDFNTTIIKSFSSIYQRHFARELVGGDKFQDSHSKILYHC